MNIKQVVLAPAIGETPNGEVDHPYFEVAAEPNANIPLASFPCERWAREWRDKHMATGEIRVAIRRLSGLNQSDIQELIIYNQAK